MSQLKLSNISRIENLAESIQKEVVVYAYYDLKTNAEIAEILNIKYKKKLYDENDVQFFLQRKIPTDITTSVVLFDELKRGALINEETNLALNKVTQYRAQTFIRLHEEVEKATKHMNNFIEKYTAEPDPNASPSDKTPPNLYDPNIYNTYLNSLSVLSRVSDSLFKMADPTKVVTTGMKALTREYAIEIGTIITEFVRLIVNDIRKGEDPEAACVKAVREIGSKMNEATEGFLEKVESISKNKSLGSTF
jgi:hypothetical protein